MKITVAHNIFKIMITYSTLKNVYKNSYYDS